jgi:hypothetical protein
LLEKTSWVVAVRPSCCNRFTAAGAVRPTSRGTATRAVTAGRWRLAARGAACATVCVVGAGWLPLSSLLARYATASPPSTSTSNTSSHGHKSRSGGGSTGGPGGGPAGRVSTVAAVSSDTAVCSIISDRTGHPPATPLRITEIQRSSTSTGYASADGLTLPSTVDADASKVSSRRCCKEAEITHVHHPQNRLRPAARPVSDVRRQGEADRLDACDV